MELSEIRNEIGKILATVNEVHRQLCQFDGMIHEWQKSRAYPPQPAEHEGLSTQDDPEPTGT